MLAIAETLAMDIEVAEASGREVGGQIRAAAVDAETNLTGAARALAERVGELRQAIEGASAVAEKVRGAAATGIQAANRTIQANAMQAQAKILDEMQAAIEKRTQQALAADRIARNWRAVAAAFVAALVLSAGSFYAGRETGYADARDGAAQAVAYDLTGVRLELQAAEQQLRNMEASATRLREVAAIAELFRGVQPEVATSVIDSARNMSETEARQLAGIVRHVKTAYTDAVRARLGLTTEVVPFPCVAAGPMGLLAYGGDQRILAHSCIMILPPGQSATGTYISRVGGTAPLGPAR